MQVVDLCWNPSPDSMAFAFVVESGSVAVVELQGNRMERIATARRIGANTSETSALSLVYSRASVLPLVEVLSCVWCVSDSTLLLLTLLLHTCKIK